MDTTGCHDAALEESEERFRAIAESGFIGICLFDETGAVTDANETFVEMFHVTRDAIQSRALTAETLTAESSLTQAQQARDEYRRVGVITPHEKEFLRPDGTQFWALVSGRKMSKGQGVGFVLDITERKRTERNQAILAEVSKELVAITDLSATIDRVAEMIGRHFRAKWCSFAEVTNPLGKMVVTYAWNDVDVPSLMGNHRWEDDRSSPSIAAVQAGEPTVICDTHTTSAVNADRFAQFGGVRASIGIPLLQAGRWRFHTWIGDTKPRKWRDDEIALLRELAERIWLRIERGRSEVALRETQARLEEALSTARMAYWTWDPQTNLTVASRSMDRLFGLSDGERFAAGMPDSELVHPNDRERRRALVDGCVERGQGWHAEFRIVRAGEEEAIWLEERATVTHDPVSGAIGTMGLVWEVTDRKRAEAARERERLDREREGLRAALAFAEESERRRLARDLHDELGQHLTALTLGLTEVRRLFESRQSAAAWLTQLEELSRLMTRDARYLALELRPPELDDVGLESAVHTYADQWAARYGVPTEVAVTGAAANEALPGPVSTALYRIVQEALTNVAKHANARHVSVLLERPDGDIQLIVEDDGRGFDLQSTGERVRKERRLGLASIRERVAMVGGTLDVESNPGRGTTIYVRVPLLGDDYPRSSSSND